jgi:hypothetical protein
VIGKIGAGVLYVQTLLIGDALELAHGILEWVALMGGAGAGVVLMYRRVWRPIYKVATAAHDALPVLEHLPARLEAMDHEHAQLANRVVDLEKDEAVFRRWLDQQADNG